LPIGREAVVKRRVVEQIRILRSKAIADTSDSYASKGTKSSGEKKMKKQRSSKSMSKSTKASKGDKEDTSTDSSDNNYNNNAGGNNNGGDTDDSENNNSDDNGDNNGGEPEAEPEPEPEAEPEPEPTDEPVAEPKPEPEPEPTDEPVDDTDGTENNGGSAEFDISDCQSYSNDWLVELADYCGPNLEDLSSCECPTAGTLLAKGVLTCASRSEKDSSPPACPKGCPVCEFCMVLEGCEDIYD
jgi:hypothetical protein